MSGVGDVYCLSVENFGPCCKVYLKDSLMLVGKFHIMLCGFEYQNNYIK